MAAVSATAREEVNAFPVDREVMFKHYFDGDRVFDRLRPYYNGSQYRFEVPVEDFDSLRRFLRRHGYDVGVVDRPEEFYVAVRQYTAHPEGIISESVRQERVEGYNCFLMTDREAVADAVEQGATRLTALPFSLSTGSIDAFARPSA